MSDEPREYTAEEVRGMFFAQLRIMVDSWAGDFPKPKTTRERLSGLVFSILVMLDGHSGHGPGFRVCPNPHPGDKQYNIDDNENWFPENADAELAGEITALPELLHYAWELTP